MDNEAFLSVDYSDATNEMYSWCSDACIDELILSLSLTVVEARLFRKLMTSHIIHHNGQSRPQTRGQLMGSIVSFPVLCIVNAAICRLALEISARWDNRVNNRDRKLFKDSFLLNELPLAINGDDAIFRTTESGRYAWGTLASLCGMQPSPGKVYFSRSFLNINSTTFDYIDRRPIGGYSDFRQVGFVNMGLLLGLKRSQISSSKTADYSLHSIADKLISQAPDLPGFRKRLLGQFIWKHRVLLKSLPIPWFLPPAFGGLGLPEVDDLRTSEQDKRFLAFALKHQDELPKIPRFPANTSWAVWDYAEKQIPARLVYDVENTYPRCLESDEPVLSAHRTGMVACSLDDYRSLLVSNAIFTQKSIRDLFDPDRSSARGLVDNYYYKLRHYWVRVRKLASKYGGVLPLQQELPARYLWQDAHKHPFLLSYGSDLTIPFSSVSLYDDDDED